LATGAGAWTRRAAAEKGVQPTKEGKTTETLKAIPSVTHMAFVELMAKGYLKFIISQNTDGLHRRSGIPVDKLAELHGNTNLETCTKCGKEYLRDYRCRNAKKVKSHLTGRICREQGCEGKLKDSIINFGESLPAKHLGAGEDNAAKADLCLAMGSSLRVTPAADLPELVAERGRLVIVNLQSTPLDDVATLRINGMCDDVMRSLMEKLKLTIPPFILRRYVHVTTSLVSAKDSKNVLVTISAVDSDGTPVSLFESVSRMKGYDDKKLSAEPFTFVIKPNKENEEVEAKFKLIFSGHYREPPLDLSLKFFTPDTPLIRNQIFLLEYNPKTRVWAEPTLLPSTHKLVMTIEKLGRKKSTDITDLTDKLEEL